MLTALALAGCQSTTPQDLSAPAPTVSPVTRNAAFDGRMKGITFGAMDLDRSRFHLIDQNLDRIKGNGFNSITLIVDWYVENHKDTRVSPRYLGGPFPETGWFAPTLSHDEIKSISRKARARGLGVVLKMHIDTLDWPFGGKSRYAIPPSKELWENYERFAIDTAKIAEEVDAQVLFIGTETDALQRSSRNWQKIINAARQNYSGPISYAASFNASSDFRAPRAGQAASKCGACNVSIWGSMDFIGFEPYVGLSNDKDASLDELKEGVRRTIDLVIAPLGRKYGKKILIPELNFYSFDGVATNPISLDSSKYKVDEMPPDHNEQALAYQAWLEVMNEDRYRDLFAGVILWAGYLTEENSKLRHWVHRNKRDLIWGKPAENTIRNVFADW